jgi:hypothetical protein
MRMAIRSNADLVAQDLYFIKKQTAPAAGRLLRHHGRLLLMKVKSHASGRPGPNIVTGGYYRALKVVHRPRGGFHRSEIITEPYKIFWRRLEHGFVGVDSLGRSVNAPPYPHYGPAVDEHALVFYTAVELMINRLIK